MRIIIFYQYFGTQNGSWSTRIYELTRRWQSAGLEITVVTSPYEKSDIKSDRLVKRMTVEGLNLIVINAADSNREPVWQRAFKSLLYATISCWFALSQKYDLILCSSGPITIGLPGIVGKFFRKKNFVFEIRDLWPQNAIELKKITNKLFIRCAFLFEKMCYKTADLVVACSPDMEKSVALRFPLTRTLLISNASDPVLFYENPDFSYLPEFDISDKKIFTYAGSIGLMDDVESIVRAMPYVKDPSVQILILGDGAERDSLESLVADLRLSSRIKFLGLLPKKKVVMWLRVSFASFVVFKDFPVLHTSSPNKLFDSFAAGIPVIHNTVGWMKTLIDNEECGITVAPGDVRGMGNAIDRLAENQMLRRKLAENAKRLGYTEFNRDILAKRYLESLLELIGGPE